MLSESPYLDYFAKLISERSVSRHTDDLVYPFRLALGSIGWTVGARPLFLYFSTEDLSVSRLASLDFLFFVRVLASLRGFCFASPLWALFPLLNQL